MICDTCKKPTGKKVKLLGVDAIIPIMCDCRKKEIEIQEKIEKRQNLERTINTLIAQGIMDRKYLNNIFENDNGENPKVLNACKKYVHNFPEMKKENIGILFFGEVGTGKTFYATCIGNALLKKGYSICVTNFPTLLSKITNFDEDSKFLIEKATTQSLLIIDDFGVERTSNFANEQMFKIIDDRWRSGLPTIITTNINIDEVSNIAQNRIYDRIIEMCPIKIKIDGHSQRKINSEKKLALARKILKDNS